MERIEQELRAGLARAVESPPAVPGLSEKIIDQGRRVRRRRTAAAGAAVAVVLVVAGVLLGPALTSSHTADPAKPTPTSVPDRGPRTAAMLENSGDYSILWPGEAGRVTELDDRQPLAAVPAGVLLRTTGLVPREVLVQAGPDAAARSLVKDLVSDQVAVSPDGRRISVVTQASPPSNIGPRDPRQLREVEVATGRVLRSVSLGPPLVADNERIDPVAYSGDAVMLTIGLGATQHTARWESGPDQVIGALDDYLAVVDGGRLGALAMNKDDPWCTEIGVMGASFTPWESCSQDFIGFSPDGSAALLVSENSRGLLVRETDGGDERAEFTSPRNVQAVGWEDDDTFLYTNADADHRDLVRCVVPTGKCQVVTAGKNMPPVLVPLPFHGV